MIHDLLLPGRVRSSTRAIQEMRALVPVFSLVGIPHKLLSVTILLAPAEAPFENRPHLADVPAAVRAQIAGSQRICQVIRVTPSALSLSAN
jgi:hypothetical protein